MFSAVLFEHEMFTHGHTVKHTTSLFPLFQFCVVEREKAIIFSITFQNAFDQKLLSHKFNFLG